jgi:hypothetical protein
VVAGAEAPPGYREEKEGLGICFEDWVCKAFWRLGLPRRGGGLHRRLAAASRSWSSQNAYNIGSLKLQSSDDDEMQRKVSGKKSIRNRDWSL